MKNASVVIVGLGSIGRRHLANLRTLGIENVFAMRRRDSRVGDDEPPAVGSHEEAIQRAPTLAIVCSPTSLHVESAIPFLRNGIPTLLEKPVAESPTRADELAQHRSGFAAVAYCLRYHPAYRRAHDFLTRGGLGRVLYAKAWFESYLPGWHVGEDYRDSYAAQRALGGGRRPNPRPRDRLHTVVHGASDAC